jgi:transcriptional regulator with XRE-family HTH domain
MRYQAASPGRLLRDARARHRVSQEQLAIRAGTTQSAISRIERDRVSPTVQTLTELLRMLGEDLMLETEKRDTGVDLSLTRRNLELTPEQRVQRGLEFADFVRRNRGGEPAEQEP